MQKTRRQRECGKKKGFRTRKLALRFCRRLELLENNTYKTLEPYVCLYCGAWHVGHISKRITMRYTNNATLRNAS